MSDEINKTQRNHRPAGRLRAFVCAARGITEAFSSELHLKIQGMIAIVVIAIGFFLQVSLLEWCLLVISISMVLTAELLNTAIERTLDRISHEDHLLTKSAKDIAAGAVLLSAGGAATVGLIVFLPRLLIFFSSAVPEM